MMDIKRLPRARDGQVLHKSDNQDEMGHIEISTVGKLISPSKLSVWHLLHFPLLVVELETLAVGHCRRFSSKLRPLVLSAKPASSLPIFPFHTNKVHLPFILVPPSDQFRHVLAAMVPDAVPVSALAPAPARAGLRKIAPLISLYDDDQRSQAQPGDA